RADLADPARPRSIFGFLVEALARRRAAGIAPFTILSCDNLPSNGETLHRLLIAHAALRSDEIARHVAEDVACPSSMVDRIVPATTDDDRIHISGLLGVEDAWPVVTEPHSQWVVEDRFPSGRPSLETVGATMVSDVMPYEHMKLRLLNGSHSALAYLGLLSGHGTVATAFGDPAIRSFVHGLWTETIPTLDKGAGLDTDTYTASLTERYDNTALAYRTAQIAGDGSQKLPQRIVASALERVSAGAPDDHMATAVAAWVLCCAERGRSLPAGCFTDPADDRLATLDPSADATALTRAAFDIAGFAVGSVGRDRLADDVSAKLDQLRRDGVAETLRSLRDQGPSS
ncbi:MAG TPA: mannitol dehydrogenase family protein, partial [Methylomirabilota bacterium]|nr:mannitol dehydrogenase family protein [Methylomirabilota bacterium]